MIGLTIALTGCGITFALIGISQKLKAIEQALKEKNANNA